MCTAVSFKSKNAYFGRNLDVDRAYGERIVIMPRRYEFKMRCTKALRTHYAMIGMATVVNGIPLYFEATNEMGLSIAGLNFPRNAVYRELCDKKENIAPFELIPLIAGRCSCVDDVMEMSERIQLVNINFSRQLPLSPLHWMISDKKRSIVLESVGEGLKVYDDPFEVLTNNPPFDYHLTNMSNYMSLDSSPAANRFGEGLPLHNYSLGMGALGLPGDYSSTSRFVRAFFVKENSVTDGSEKSAVNQFFHILYSVSMPRGCVRTASGFEHTRYSSCCNADKGIYYYTTYDSFGISSVNMHDADLDSTELCIHQAAGLA